MADSEKIFLCLCVTLVRIKHPDSGKKRIDVSSDFDHCNKKKKKLRQPHGAVALVLQASHDTPDQPHNDQKED